MRARARVFLLKPVPVRPFDQAGLCDCCGLGATAARAWFDWPPDAHFECCWLCAELITAQAMIGCALKLLVSGKGN